MNQLTKELAELEVLTEMLIELKNAEISKLKNNNANLQQEIDRLNALVNNLQDTLMSDAQNKETV